MKPITANGVGTSALAFGYKVVASDATGSYLVLHNADTVARTFTQVQDLRSAQLWVDGTRAGTSDLGASTTVTLSADGLTVTLAPLSSAIYKF